MASIPCLTRRHRLIFIDTCMQAWPDADYPCASARLYGLRCHRVLAQPVRRRRARGPDVLAPDGAQARQRGRRPDRRRHPRGPREGKGAPPRQPGRRLPGRHLHRLEAFYRLGLRMMLPAYNSSNLICDGCLDRTDRGLTAFGKLVVGEANRVGMLLDGTHIGERSSLEMIDASEDPVVFSHANPASLFPNPRNLSDAQIRASAASGGVIGVVPWRPVPPGRAAHAPYARRPARRRRLHRPTDGIHRSRQHRHRLQPRLVPCPSARPLGSAHQPRPGHGRLQRVHVAQLPQPRALRRGLLELPGDRGCRRWPEHRGYSETDVAKVLGENWLRVFGRVWKAVS